MLKVFISQPMNGKTDEHILKEREMLTSFAKERYGDDIEIVDSFFNSFSKDAKPLFFLGESIKALSKADVAYFAKDWQSARGCRIEHQCALEYGLEVVECYKY